MRRTLLALSAFLALAPAAQAETIKVNPGQTLAAAYNVARAGDVILVAPGVYPRQTIPEGTKAVTFRGLPGSKIRSLHTHASNVVFDNIDVDAGFGPAPDGVFANDGHNMTFKNGRIGNVNDEKGVMLVGWESTASQGIVFDNVLFHNVHQPTDGVHNECIFSQSPGLTIRNSTFRDCATMDVMITRGDWWGQPSYGGVTLENNVFAHPVNGADPLWHYYGFLVHGNMGRLTNARIVNNTFETPVGGVTNAEIGAASGVWANNIGGGWDCLAGMTYRGNVGQKCHGSDVAVSPDHSCAPPTCSPRQIAPMGWVDSVGFDFHLKAGSPAIGAAFPQYATARDRDGKLRDGDPDAGAYEHGPGGSEGGGAPTTPGAGWRMGFAKLTKRTICRTPRRRCPGSTKLRLGLGRPAAVVVRLDRLRKGGKKAKRARVKRLRQVGLHRATRLRARGLKAGRYRVTVRATDASGLRSAPVRLKLRVR